MLDSYTGMHSFTFLLNTNGMRLYNEDGQYYLATSAEAEEKMYLGQIVVYDAKGEPCPGTMSITTVTMGQQYQITVSADPDFLTNPNTEYPVTIDPSLTISDSTQSGAIEDASVYENKPTVNAGSWTYNHCGYYTSSSTVYGVSRTVYRLTGLINDANWPTIVPEDIVSAKLYVKEASGEAGATLNIRALSNTTWTETGITWNTLGSHYPTVYASSAPGYGAWGEWDITNLVLAWKYGTRSILAGFEMVSADEFADSKTLYASEYGTADRRPYFTVTYNYDTDGLNYTSKDIDEAHAFQLTWPGVDAPITWSSSNSAIASVSSTGIVTGVKAGTATISATAAEYGTKTCTVYVTIADGIYRIKNVLSQYYLGVVSSGVTDGSTLRQEAKLSTEPEQFAQMWFVKHLSGTNYSIRPVHKPSKGLSVTSSIVNIRPIGNTDTYASVPASGRWNISFSLNGYVIKNEGSALAPNSLSSSVNATIAVSTQTTSSAYRWTFEPIDDINDQLAMYDIRTHTYSDSIVRYIAPGETLTLAELGIDATYITSQYTTQPLVWDSEDPDYVSINTVTGTVTGISPNQTTVITVTRNTSGAHYTQSYTIHVTAIEEGAYYIRNWYSGMYADFNLANIANDPVITQQELDGALTQQWEFTHLGDGTYSIKTESTSTAYYLGVQNNSSANDQPIVLTDGAIGAGTKWKVSFATSGACILTALSGEANNRVLNLEIGSTDVPSLAGATLRQREYGNDTSYIDEWLLCPVSTDYVLEPQETNVWCWVAAAQIACSRYMTTPITQASAAVYAKWGYITLNPSPEEVSSATYEGYPFEIENALEYFLGSMDVYSAENRIYDEEILQSLLSNSLPVIILRGWYEDNGLRNGGHYTVIINYRWNDALKVYEYEVLDPWPVGPDNHGTVHWRSYASICNGRNSLQEADEDNGIWESIVVIASGDCQNTIPWTGVN